MSSEPARPTRLENHVVPGQGCAVDEHLLVTDLTSMWGMACLRQLSPFGAGGGLLLAHKTLLPQQALHIWARPIFLGMNSIVMLVVVHRGHVVLHEHAARCLGTRRAYLHTSAFIRTADHLQRSGLGVKAGSSFGAELLSKGEGYTQGCMDT